MTKRASRKNRLVTPFVKWVGGKRQLLPAIKKLMPDKSSYTKYMEAFIGGGAVFFDLEPASVIINDCNKDLINVYNTIKLDVDLLIEDLKNHDNTSEYFYDIRAVDRTEEFKNWSEVKKASRLLFLNKTCYNGLYRVNNAGQFNSPFGRYKNPNIVNEPVLRAVSKYLNTANVTIYNEDYIKVLELAEPDTFVYLDPPYHPLSETSNFTGYIAGGWGEKEQIELKEACDKLSERGVKFILSNSSAQFIKDLYADYNIYTIGANRSINSKGNQRGEVDEFLIRNFE